MCSYNSVNGVPSCASRWMQTEILRGNWSYDGYVVGDSDTVQYINTAHHYVNNPAAAVQAALHAGTDIESWTLGGGLDYYRDVIPTMYVFFGGGSVCLRCLVFVFVLKRLKKNVWVLNECLLYLYNTDDPCILSKGFATEH